MSFKKSSFLNFFKIFLITLITTKVLKPAKVKGFRISVEGSNPPSATIAKGNPKGFLFCDSNERETEHETPRVPWFEGSTRSGGPRFWTDRSEAKTKSPFRAPPFWADRSEASHDIRWMSVLGLTEVKRRRPNSPSAPLPIYGFFATSFKRSTNISKRSSVRKTSNSSSNSQSSVICEVFPTASGINPPSE